MVADISSRSVPRELAVGHGREPDVGVEADLMAGMAGEHRAAARLRHVADQEPAPAGLGRLLGQLFEEFHQHRDGPSCGCATAASPARSWPLIGSAMPPARQPLA